MSDKRCHYCNEGREKSEMRPYGPGGSWIHFECMKADPAREQAAKQNFGALLDAASAMSDIVVIGQEDGPIPGPAR